MHPFHYTQRRLLSIAAAKRKAIKKFNAPEAIMAIPDPIGPNKGKAGALIRPIGGARRVFLLNPELTPREVEGLAYRIKALSTNEAISSVLIATDDRDDASSGALPTMLLNREAASRVQAAPDLGFPVGPGKTWHVSQGYDPLALYKNRSYKDMVHVEALMTHLSSLALAVRGDAKNTKIPIICMPHGLVSDAGFAFCMSTYVMATRETCFRIFNPSRGLSLDPVGLSYVLPRLGQEFDQPSANYSGCGMILGLMGYEADAADMLETGLATHYCESASILERLETALSHLPPWEQQALMKKPYRYEGQPEPTTDNNAMFRNVAVADCIHCFSSYRADGAEVWEIDENEFNNLEDPCLDIENMPSFAERVSDLVNYAATFDDIFTSESTLVGILERFKEVAATQTFHPEEQEGIDVAADFVKRLERQSPLAVSVVFELLRAGAKDDETLESCLERERRVQAKMIAERSDFEKWASATVASSKQRDTPSSSGMDAPFSAWTHKDIASVTRDEVMEIIESPF